MEREEKKHDGGHDDKHEVTVFVTYSNTGRTVKIETPKNTKLQEVFEEAYKKLGEPKRDGDTYYCINGAALSGELQKAIEAILKTVCKEGKFEIRTATGGA